MKLDDNLLARLRGLEKYFKQAVERGDLMFRPEYEAMVKINALLQNGDIDKEKIIRTITIFNETNETTHYNGSGWFDVKLHLVGLARQFDVKVTDSSTFGKGDIELI